MAKEQELRNSIEGDIASFEDREKFLLSELEGTQFLLLFFCEISDKIVDFT